MQQNMCRLTTITVNNNTAGIIHSLNNYNVNYITFKRSLPSRHKPYSVQKVATFACFFIIDDLNTFLK